VTNIEITKNPPSTQYEGTAYNLKGMELTLTYEDGGTEKVTETSKFKISPPYVQGVVLEDEFHNFVWVPVTDYTVSYGDGTFGLSKVLHPTVVPIQRGLSSAAYGTSSFQFVTVPVYYKGGEQEGIWGGTSLYYLPISSSPASTVANPRPGISNYVVNSALNLVGDEEISVYVDDNPLDYKNAFKLQATYTDLTKHYIPIENTDMLIRTHYSNGKGTSGIGDILISVKSSQAVDANAVARAEAAAALIGTASYGTSFDLANSSKSQLVAVHNLTNVEHVTKIEITNPPDATDKDKLPSMYYWESESTSFWADKLKDKGIGLKVWYTDGTSKDRSIDWAMQKGMVWWNENPPDDEYDTFGIYDVRTTSTPAKKALLTYPKISDPRVRINYRGAEAEVQVNVYTKVESIRPEYVSGGDIITANLKSDDNDIGGNDASWYADQIKVWAVLSSPRGFQTEVELAFAGDDAVSEDGTGLTSGSTYLAATEGAPGDDWDLNYTMDFGKPAWYDKNKSGADPTDPESYWEDDWRNAFNSGILNRYALMADGDGLDIAAFGLCNNASNNGKEKAVKFYYSTPLGDEDATGYTTPKVLKGTLNVSWTNIHKR